MCSRLLRKNIISQEMHREFLWGRILLDKIKTHISEIGYKDGT